MALCPRADRGCPVLTPSPATLAYADVWTLPVPTGYRLLASPAAPPPVPAGARLPAADPVPSPGSSDAIRRGCLCPRPIPILPVGGVAAIDRFWSHVNKNGPLPNRADLGPCWEWTGATVNGGYGAVRWNRKTCRANRVSWAISNGADPGELDICHHCDNPKCVRPSHLFAGTADDNLEDMRSKGRSRPAAGERSGNAKTSEADVAEMRKLRASGVSVKDIAARFHHLHPTQVGRILNGRKWIHSFAGDAKPIRPLVNRGTHRKKGQENPNVPCACGCGQFLSQFDACGRPRRFISGHNMNKPPRPTPGSPAAVAQNCVCPIIDNHHGDGRPGRGGPVFVFNAECPIHGVPAGGRTPEGGHPC